MSSGGRATSGEGAHSCEKSRVSEAAVLPPLPAPLAWAWAAYRRRAMRRRVDVGCVAQESATGMSRVLVISVVRVARLERCELSRDRV